MKPRIIFIHGNGGGTGDDAWFPWAARQLEASGFLVLRPTFPDAVLARAAFWLPYLQDTLHADDCTVLVGHSSGAVAALRYAEGHQLLGSAIVAASYTDLGDATERQSGYFDRSWDWEAIRRNQKWVIQFASTDDPYIPIAEARHIHEQLHTDYTECTDQGHFGTDAVPKKEFTELVAALRAKFEPVR